MKQFAVYQQGDFIYDEVKCALFITPSINLAMEYQSKCDFGTNIVSININNDR